MAKVIWQRRHRQHTGALIGLQSSNLAPHVGGTGRLNGLEIAQIDSDGGRLSIVTMSLAVTVWPQIATPFPILGEGEGAAGRR